jgi:glycosyltransferase involved in cell wall biosynthesis
VAAHNNIKYLFLLIFFLCKLKGAKLNIIAVGGWLSEFIKDKPLHQKLLGRVNNLYAQTENLAQSLREKYNFSNVSILNNFRNVEYPETSVTQNNILKLVFFARVQPMKGVNVLFDLAKKIEQENICNVKIDIYGPISDFYKEEFDRLLSTSQVDYRGILQPHEIHSTLSQYDLMLFPTKYYTEGFPGSILDSYISGVPVLATKWINAEEFIDHEKTGYIVEFDNDNKFIEQTISLIKNHHLVKKLKENVVTKRYLYTSEQAWKILSLSLK